MKRAFFIGASLVIILGLFIGGSFVKVQDNKARIGVGYMVKVTCSEVFVAGRDADVVLAEDFFGIDPLLEKVKVKIDSKAQTVTGSIFGLGKSKAVYRPQAGCTVFANHGVDPVAIPAPNVVPHTYDVNIKPDVQSALSALFDDSALAHPIVTRGALVIQDGVIVAEQYAPGFTKDTPQQSWSMAKSFTSALTGHLVEQGLLSLDDTHLSPEWIHEGDVRAQISLDDLLKMSSGLGVNEDYSDPNSDSVQMLFNSRDTARAALSEPYESAPGTVFEYSSATTNFISGLIRRRMGDDDAYHALPRKILFDPLGMSSAIFEVDPTGNFIGSSYIYATPRDFARFGQLYLQGGIWEGKRLLPESWVDYSHAPAPASGGKYGAQWWINESGDRLPDLPKDVFYMSGNDGQFVIVIPEKNAIIVRMGLTRAPASFAKETYPLIRNIYNQL